MTGAVCDVGRLEVDPDYLPACEHPEHWATVPEERVGWLDWDDAPATCRCRDYYATCYLDAGHDGPHSFCSEWCSAADLAARHEHGALRNGGVDLRRWVAA